MKRRWMGFLLAPALLAACPTPSGERATDTPGATSGAAGTAGTAVVEGQLDGRAFVPKDAIVVRLPRKKQRGDIAWVVLSTAPDACQAYLDGSLHLQLFEPRQQFSDSRFIVWTVFAGMSNDADFAVGPFNHGIPAFEGKSPLRPPGPGPFGFAQAGDAGPTCEQRDIRFDYPTLTSEFALTAVGTPEEPLAATFRLAQGATDLRGSFVARPCQPPPDWPEPAAPACRPAPTGPRTGTAVQAAAQRFAPLGEPTGEAGVCWEAELSCVTANPSDPASVRRVELARQAFRDRQPIPGVPFPDPATGASTAKRWVSHTRSDGEGGSMVREVRASESRWTYDLDGDLLEVDRMPADGLYHATFTTRARQDKLVCQLPRKAGGEPARWRYSRLGDCP